MRSDICAHWGRTGEDRCFAASRCFNAHPGGVSRGNAMIDEAIPPPELCVEHSSAKMLTSMSCWTGLKTRICEFGERCLYLHPWPGGRSRGNSSALGFRNAAVNEPRTITVEQLQAVLNLETMTHARRVAVGAINCQSFVKHGSCQVGPFCMLRHPGGESAGNWTDAGQKAPKPIMCRTCNSEAVRSPLTSAVLETGDCPKREGCYVHLTPLTHSVDIHFGNHRSRGNVRLVEADHSDCAQAIASGALPKLFLEPRLSHPRNLERYLQTLPESMSAPHLLPDGTLRNTYERPFLRHADIAIGQVSVWTGEVYAEDNLARRAGHLSGRLLTAQTDRLRFGSASTCPRSSCAWSAWWPARELVGRRHGADAADQVACRPRRRLALHRCPAACQPPPLRYRPLPEASSSSSTAAEAPSPSPSSVAPSVSSPERAESAWPETGDLERDHGPSTAVTWPPSQPPAAPYYRGKESSSVGDALESGTTSTLRSESAAAVLTRLSINVATDSHSSDSPPSFSIRGRASRQASAQPELPSAKPQSSWGLRSILDDPPPVTTSTASSPVPWGQPLPSAQQQRPPSAAPTAPTPTPPQSRPGPGWGSSSSRHAAVSPPPIGPTKALSPPLAWGAPSGQATSTLTPPRSRQSSAPESSASVAQVLGPFGPPAPQPSSTRIAWGSAALSADPVWGLRESDAVKPSASATTVLSGSGSRSAPASANGAAASPSMLSWGSTGGTSATPSTPSDASATQSAPQWGLFGQTKSAPPSTRGSFSSSTSSGVCDICQHPGHQSKQCPNNTCYNCGQNGHYSRECPHDERAFGSCFVCGSVEHQRRTCKVARPAWMQLNVKCHRCDKMGHIGIDCPDNTPLKCINCDGEGHVVARCPKPCRECDDPGHTVTLCFRGRTNEGPPPPPSAPASPVRALKSSWSELDWDDAPDPPAPPPAKVRPPSSPPIERAESWLGQRSPPAVASSPRVTPRQQLGWSFITSRHHRASASSDSVSDTPTEVPARVSGPASTRTESSDGASFVSCDTASRSTSPRPEPRPLPSAVIVAIAFATAEIELADARLDPIAHPSAHARAFARIIGDLTTIHTTWATPLEPIRFRHVGSGSDEELVAVIEAVVGNADRAETVRTLAIERLSDASVPSVGALVLCCGALVELVVTFASARADGERVLKELNLGVGVAGSPSLRRLTLGSLPPTPLEAFATVVGPGLRTLRLQDTTATGEGNMAIESLELQGVDGNVLGLIDRVASLRLDGPVISTTPAQLLAHLRQTDVATALRSVTLGGLTSSSRWRGSTAEMRLLRTVAGRRGIEIAVTA